MAARQALIVILIIISPLAFVAYLLPGTEKWFDKWKDVFDDADILPGLAAAFGAERAAGGLSHYAKRRGTKRGSDVYPRYGSPDRATRPDTVDDQVGRRTPWQIHRPRQRPQ